MSDERRVTQLLLVRHADAGDPEAWSGDDAARPLSPKGRRQAEQLGAFLAQMSIAPDLIVSSPKVRARETAEIVASSLGLTVAIDERLASGFGQEAAEAILTGHGDHDRPLLVGHDPDFSALVSDLCLTDAIPMRKGAFVRIDIERPIHAGGGTLRWLVPPDLIRGRDRHT